MKRPATSSLPKSLPWISLITGTIGLLLLLLVMGDIYYALAHEYPQPGDRIVQYGWITFPLAFIFSAVALALGIMALRRRDRLRWVAYVGIMTGTITFVMVSLITMLFVHF